MAQVCSELRPWTKALEEQLDILRERKYHDFLECVWDHKAKLKLYSAWREALQDFVNTATVAKVMVYQKLHKQDGIALEIQVSNDQCLVFSPNGFAVFVPASSEEVMTGLFFQ
ncbi:hypothetical protein ABG768_025265 [Culter alburnus]|uniref:Uncharacterized protein n=1 Tax=Culter alburnus TaxID=194366 RepID=A0AAW2AES0_CULAL